jgi:hypothetical protein
MALFMMTFFYRKSVILILIVSTLSKLCHPERSEGSYICPHEERSDEAISDTAFYSERSEGSYQSKTKERFFAKEAQNDLWLVILNEVKDLIFVFATACAQSMSKATKQSHTRRSTLNEVKNLFSVFARSAATKQSHTRRSTLNEVKNLFSVFATACVQSRSAATKQSYTRRSTLNEVKNLFTVFATACVQSMSKATKQSHVRHSTLNEVKDLISQKSKRKILRKGGSE